MAVEQSDFTKEQVELTIDGRWSQVCDYCESILEIPVLKSKRGMTPQMNETFASVDLLNVEGFAKDLKEYVDTGDDLIQKVIGRCILFFKVQLFGAKSFDFCQMLKVSFSTDRFNMFGETHRFGLSAVNDVVNISGLFLDSVYEERAEIEFSLYTYIPYQYYIDWFNKMKISVEVNDVVEHEIEINMEEK